MKRFGDLFEQIVTFENLLLAAKKAQKGKRKRNSTAAFHFRLEENLLQLQRELIDATYVPGEYRTFYVFEPKKRLISAAPYRDRVIHHALCNIIEPIFEKTFISDSYANRKGKGTHKALIQYQKFARKSTYVLKCDIRRFFPSIDHEILKQSIRRKIKCKDTLRLIDLIIDNSNPQEKVLQWFPGDDLFAPLEHKKGLPIGNLTSQFWANVYMNSFDHYVKEVLGVKQYIRYVDDFVLFGDSKPLLWAYKRKIEAFLAGKRLIIHPNKTEVFHTHKGVPFLGFMVFPYYKFVRKEKTKRFNRYLRKQLKNKKIGTKSPQSLEDSLNAWLGHIRFGVSIRKEYNIYSYICAQGVNLVKHPSGSWRVLEQQ